MTQTTPISVILPIADIDLKAIPLNLLTSSDPISLQVMDFLIQEIEKAGGIAIIEASDYGITCWWETPAVITDKVQVWYVAHMLQSGLLLHPVQILANTAYAGNGAEVASNLVEINAKRLNPYVVERDIMILALAVPQFIAVWLACALIMFSNGKTEISDLAFKHLLDIDPTNQIGIKYLAISLTKRDPKRAVVLVESLLGLLACNGETPGVHTRVAYGFALKSAKMAKEAALQFDIVSGEPIPKMTIQQWIEWGYSVPDDKLVEVLGNPEVR